MGVARGLVAFGMSAVVTAGGVAALNKWEQEWEKIHAQEAVVVEARACQDIANFGKAVCREQLVLKSSELPDPKQDGDAALYAFLGGLGITLGGIGAAASITDTLGLLPDKREVAKMSSKL